MKKYVLQYGDQILIVSLVILMVTMNISIEEMTAALSGAQILALRSAGTLILVLPIAILGRQSLKPSYLKYQIIRFFASGLGLLLTFKSFEYISAGSVALLARFDIPLLMLFTMFRATVSRKRIFLSILSLVLLIVLLFFSKKIDEPLTGYFIGMVGVLCLVVSTLLTKRLIHAKESTEVLIYISCLSAIFWSLLECWRTGLLQFHLAGMQYAIILVLSFVNLGTYYIVKHLYDYYSVEYVRYPYLLSAFATMIVEMIVEQKLFSPILITGNTVILLVMTLLVEKTIPANEPVVIR